MASGKKGSAGGLAFILILLVISLYFIRRYNNDQRKVQIFDSLLDQYVEITEEEARKQGISGNIGAEPEDIVVPGLDDARDRMDDDMRNRDEEGGNEGIGADRTDIMEEIRRLSERMCLFPPDDQYGCYGAFEEDPDQGSARDEALAMIPVLESQLVEANLASDTLRIAELNSELKSVQKSAYDIVCCNPKEVAVDDDNGLSEMNQLALELGASIIVGIFLEEVVIKRAIGVKPKYTPPGKAAKAATKKILKEATEEAATEAGEKAARRALAEGLDEAGQKLAREVAETGVRSTTNVSMRKLAEEVGEEAAEKIFKEVGDEAAEKVVREGGDKAAQLAARKLAEEGATEAMEKASSKAIKGALGDLTEAVVREAVTAAVEEGVETAAALAAGQAAADQAAQEGLDEAAQLLAREKAADLVKRQAAQAATEKAAREAGDAAAQKAVRAGTDILGQKIAREAAEKGVRDAAEAVIGKALIEKNIRDAVLNTTVKRAGDKAATQAAKEGLDEAGQRVAREVAEKSAREAGEQAAKKAIAKALAKKAAKKATAKVVAKVGVKIAAKVATKVAKYAMLAVAGPPGWVAGALMLAFDALSLLLDIFDVDGYGTYTPNSALELIRSKVLADGEREAIQGGDGDWPALFPITEIVPLEYPIAVNMMTSDMTLNYGMPTVEFDAIVGPEYTAYIETVVEQIQSGLEPSDPPESFVEYLVGIPKVYHKQRDIFIFEHLKTLIKMSSTPERVDMLVLLPFMSSPNRVGISITPEAAANWNTNSMPLWMANNAIIPPFPESCEEYIDPMAAMYTDVFYTMNPGFYDESIEKLERTEDMPGDMLTNPVLTPVPIRNEAGQQVKVVLGAPFGPSVAFCLKPRVGGLPGLPTTVVDPQAFEVEFDFTTGMCQYTKDFCTRYGMDFANNDCKDKPGMWLGEAVFGETISKGFVRTYQTYVMDNIQSKNPEKVAAGLLYASNPLILGAVAIGEAIFGKAVRKEYNIVKKRECEDYGDRYRDDGTSCWLDTIPKKSSITKKKDCSEWERQADGTPGSAGGEFTKLESDGTSCWAHTEPIGSSMTSKKHCDNWSHKYGRKLRSDGTSCWRDTLMKNSDTADKEDCDEWAHEYGTNMRDDGTSCWRDTEVKDTDTANKRDCKGAPIKQVVQDGEGNWVEGDDVIPGKYEWRDTVVRADGVAFGEGQGKLRFDGTSCWRDIYAKNSNIADKYDCKGPQMRDSDGSLMPDKYEWRDKVVRADGVEIGEGRGKLDSDGTSCWKHLYAKKFKSADLKSCSKWNHKYQGAELETDGTSCWLHLKGRKGKLPGCGENEEKKGVLCYNKCDTSNRGVRGSYKPYKLYEDGSADGVQIYKSRALECEGICPPGTSDNGFFCTDWIETFFKNIGNFETTDVYYDSCSDKQVNPNSGKGQRLLAAGKSLSYGFDDIGLTCHEPCEPGTTFRSGAIGSGFCNKEKGRYSRGVNPKTADTCPDGYPNNQLGICYKDCPTGYNGIGPLCEPKSGVGIKVTAFQRHYCGPSSYQPDKCKDLASGEIDKIIPHLQTIGGQDLINRINTEGLTDELYTEAEQALECPVLRKNEWGVCWDECKPGDTDAGFICDPAGGFGIKKTLFDRYYCGDSSYQSDKCEDIASKDISRIKPHLETANRQDLINLLDINGLTDTLHDQISHVMGCPEKRDNVAGVCWDTCKTDPETGEKDENWGALCKPRKKIGIIKTLFDRYYCEDEKKTNVLGICWEDCDRFEEENSTYDKDGNKIKHVNYEDIGALCHPKMGPGIKVDMFRRGVCGPSTWQPKQCEILDSGDTLAVIDLLKDVPNMDDYSFRTGVGLPAIIQGLENESMTLDDENVMKDVKEALDCPRRRKNIAGICWDRCPPYDENDHSVGHGVDYKDIGLLCHPKGGPGIKVPVWDREVCGPKEYQKQECINIQDENIDATVQDLNAIGETALASSLASAGEYTRDEPTDEFPEGMERMKMNVETALGCPERRKKILGVCWDDCPPRYTRIGALCQPPGGPGIKVPVWEREYCGPSSHQSPKCDDVDSRDMTKISGHLTQIGRGDLVDRIDADGLTDILYSEVESALECPVLRKRVLGVCWDTCPNPVTPKNVELFKTLRTQYFTDKPVYEEARRDYYNLTDIISRDDGFTPDYMLQRKSGGGNGQPGHRWSDDEVSTYNTMFAYYLQMKEEYITESGSQDNFTDPCMPGFKRSNLRNGYCAPLQGWVEYSTLADKLNEYKSIYETLKESFDVLSENYSNEKKEYERTRSFGYDDIGLLCQPKGGRDEVTNKTKSSGPGIKVTNMKRAYCDDNQDMFLGVCYDKCPDGYRDDGLYCNDRSGVVDMADRRSSITTSTGACMSDFDTLQGEALEYSEAYISTPLSIQYLPDMLKSGEIEISEFLLQYFDEMGTFDSDIIPTSIIPTMNAVMIELGDVQGMRLKYTEKILEMYTTGEFTPLLPPDQTDLEKFLVKYSDIERDGFVLDDAPKNVRDPVNLLFAENARISIINEVDKFNRGEDPYVAATITDDGNSPDEILNTFTFIGVYIGLTGTLDMEDAPDAARPILESGIEITGSVDKLKLAFGALLGYADFVGEDDAPPPTTDELLVDTGSIATINGVMIRGLDAFKVYTSDEIDGVYNSVVSNDGYVFMGDVSSNDPLLVEFPIPVAARFVRIYVRRWNETFTVPLTEEEKQTQLIQIEVDKFNQAIWYPRSDEEMYLNNTCIPIPDTDENQCDPYTLIHPVEPEEEITEATYNITKIFTFIGNYLMITRDIVIEDAIDTARPILESGIEITGSLEDLKLAFAEVYALL